LVVTTFEPRTLYSIPFSIIHFVRFKKYVGRNKVILVSRAVLHCSKQTRTAFSNIKIRTNIFAPFSTWNTCAPCSLSHLIQLPDWSKKKQQ
jgi:hypothetical protein